MNAVHFAGPNSVYHCDNAKRKENFRLNEITQTCLCTFSFFATLVIGFGTLIGVPVLVYHYGPWAWMDLLGLPLTGAFLGFALVTNPVEGEDPITGKNVCAIWANKRKEKACQKFAKQNSRNAQIIASKIDVFNSPTVH